MRCSARACARARSPASAQKDIRADATAASAGIRRRTSWRAERCAHAWSPSFVIDGRAARVSAVIACYKDAQAIPQMYQRLSSVFSALAVDYEIIFVNDGSPDDSMAVLQALTAQD